MCNDCTGNNIDNEESSVLFFCSVHMSHSQDHHEDLMEQEMNSHEVNIEDLYSKTLNAVHIFSEFSKVQC